MKMKIRRFTADDSRAWDSFVAGSKNATFLFCRRFMDYHADRFVDASLLILDDHDRLVALLPATRKDDVVSSHGGLTYGGFLTDQDMTAAEMLRVLEAVLDFYRAEGVTQLIYKPIPHIYHRLRAEEDLYALFRFGFELVRRDVSTTVDLAGHPLRLTKGRKWSIKRAAKLGITCVESPGFEAFMQLEEQTLLERHGTKPVHSGAEMQLLASRFPENIRLFVANHEQRLAAGVLVFDAGATVHAQYIAATSTGRETGATDAVIAWLLNEVFADRRYFDFGVSTESSGRVLNDGLAAFKESFGGRSTLYDHYRLQLSR